MEFPGAGLDRLITINSVLNGPTHTSEAPAEAERASVKIWEKLAFNINFLRQKSLQSFYFFFIDIIANLPFKILLDINKWLKSIEID
jgi:hypothetical protein